MSKARWTVGGADPSGNAYDILKTADPVEALAKLEALRVEADHPGSGLSNRTYFVYDAEEPERGDAQMLLEEMVEDEAEEIYKAARREANAVGQK